MGTSDLWLDDEDLPLRSTYGGVEFVVFEARMTALLRATTALSRGVETYLDSLREEASAPTHSPEEEVYVHEELSWAKELVPTYSFGGLFALAFTTLEALLTDVCDRVAQAVGTPLSEFRGAAGAPAIERMLEYLARIGDVKVDRGGEEWRRFVTLRQLRNRLVHSLGEDVSPALDEQLQHSLEQRPWSVDARTVRVAVRAVSAVAVRVGDALSATAY
jgi:hypothetical protein